MKIMPKEVDSSKEEPTGTPAETGKPKEPEKLTIPGLEGEFTAEQVREWYQDNVNKKDWRRELDAKGRELNEIRHASDIRNAELDRKIAELDSRVASSQTTTKVDWRTLEDPYERERLREQELREERDKDRKRIEELEKKVTAADLEKAQSATYEYWNNVYEDTIEKHAFEDEKANEMLRSLCQKRLTDMGADKWSPEVYEDTIKTARKEIEDWESGAIDRHVQKKKDAAVKKPLIPGQTPAPPVGEKLKAGDTWKDRREKMAKDPNLQNF